LAGRTGANRRNLLKRPRFASPVGDQALVARMSTTRRFSWLSYVTDQMFVEQRAALSPTAPD
jgi:hypothetical protein